jgi:hypothetical protein
VIQVVHGIPGTGKDYYVACRVAKALASGRRVYSNSAFTGARRLYSLVDALNPAFEGSLFVITEAGSYFDARQTLKEPMPPVIFSAFTMHRHFGTDLLMNCQSIGFLDVQVRRVVQEYILMSRGGADATRRLLRGQRCWCPYFQRPLWFRARAYGPHQFASDMSLLGQPAPKWSSVHFFRRATAGSFNTASQSFSPDVTEEVERWAAGAQERAAVEPWRVEQGRVVFAFEGQVPIPSGNNRRLLL